MDLPLVVGVDGSESSLAALDWAVDEAARHGLPLRLVQASLWERYEGLTSGPPEPSEQEMAERVVSCAVERARLRNAEVEVFGEVLAEDPAEALVHESRHAFAVVVGSLGHGRLAGMLLGSVGLAVAGRGHCPVVVVRGPRINREGRFRRVVLGAADDTPPSSPAVAFAVREARARGGELLALHIRRPFGNEPGLNDLERALGERLGDDTAAHARLETAEGCARKVLLDTASTADLLVVGARRRHGSAGLQLGRVNHAVLHHAPCPVAVVPEE
ncbi:universal stress protein [Wenjunlia tyrosinilytica]|uniref:Universal stress protein n=1 Tax=Wenjunlia tyrosinilytica TaxID=1544741 RepID=A0A917ZPN9_9ACTN|nr:universal stress protein [Wenjunlia tyrosinilytica]GGO87398.1 universal stress protein [Wenjunlia tyrosinilytica]